MKRCPSRPIVDGTGEDQVGAATPTNASATSSIDCVSKKRDSDGYVTGWRVLPVRNVSKVRLTQSVSKDCLGLVSAVGAPDGC
jgi:hypothetical protein